MILRCLPQEVLAADISEFEASGAAATEIGIPMSMILGQLPSGKVELALQDLVPHFPAGYLQPTQSITNYLPTLVNLPLMDVVMRIPPDLLALRPDQKDVDSAVINMADPFTEEILREQAEAARRQNEANIIDESQVPPTEEFVPQAQAPKTIAPPVRPPSVPLPVPAGGPSLRPPSAALPTPTGAPPMPQVNKLPAPPLPRPGGAPTTTSAVRANSPVPPSAPSVIPRGAVATGRLPVPTRATVPIVTRSPENKAMPPAPPITPSPAAAIPAPPPPRQAASPSTSLRPPVTAPTPPVPILPNPATVTPEEAVQAEASPAAAAAPSAQPDGAADELQRLAALAMMELGDGEGEPAPAEEAAPEQIQPEPEPVAAIQEPIVEEAAVEEPVPEQLPPVAELEPAPEAEAEKVSIASVPPPPSIFQQAPQKGITEPIPTLSSLEVARRKAEEAPALVAPTTPSAAVAINLNSCIEEDLLQISGCSRELAESIVRHRIKIGSFKKLEDLYSVPGMTKMAYTSLTGEAPPEGTIPQTLNEFLGFPAEQNVSLKDVTDRIACWPDVTGCVLSQSSGLSLVGNVPAGLDKAALVAFAPRMFESINKSFNEIAGKETDELIIPTSGISFHILRNKDLYLIILSRLPQMPDRHMKVARLVLAELSIRQN
jgi:DNA uptake protein ComE-like DNA-binding protein